MNGWYIHVQPDLDHTNGDVLAMILSTTRAKIAQHSGLAVLICGNWFCWLESYYFPHIQLIFREKLDLLLEISYPRSSNGRGNTGLHKHTPFLLALWTET